MVCWQVAGLLWLLFAPAGSANSLALPMPVPAHGVSRDAFLRWYGAEVKAAGPGARDFSLMAVIAGERGAALLKGSDGLSVAVRVGDDIRPGSKLLAVEPTGITIEQGGVRQELKLPQTATQGLFSRSESRSAARASALKPIRITRGQMVAMMQGGNIAGWDQGLSTSSDGGIRIEKAGAQPFAKLLQLKDGDLLKRINERPLERINDISLISFYFGQHASVDVELVRHGALLTQHYDIQP